MRKLTAMMAGLVVAISVSDASHAQQEGSKSLTGQDYLEIQQLYAQYNWALDSHADNGMAYAKMYTPDGEFVYDDDIKIVGHEEFAKFAVQSTQGDAPRHYATNVIAVPSPEGARGGAYLFSVSGGLGGTYDDILVKTTEGWRFKRRELHRGKLTPMATLLVSQ